METVISDSGEHLVVGTGLAMPTWKRLVQRSVRVMAEKVEHFKAYCGFNFCAQTKAKGRANGSSDDLAGE